MKGSRKKRIQRSLNTQVRKHLGKTKGVQVLTHTFPAYQIANVSVVLNRFFLELDPDARIVGAKGDGGVLERARWVKGRFQGREERVPDYKRVVLAAGEEFTGLEHGVVFFRFEGAPMLAWCWIENSFRPEYNVEIFAQELERAERVLTRLGEYEKEQSIFRGKLLKPKIDYGERIVEAEVLEYPALAWQDAILPASLRECLERDVLGYINAAPLLQLNGVEPKRGILFHGPPGTGKTYVCKQLLSQLEGFTAVLCTGDGLYHPSASFELAARYAPSLIFFEDIDLIAQTREVNSAQHALGTLLNELDGLGKRDRVYAIFTTNRLHVLEEALAQRPGRVDVVLEFPLPSPALREQLLRLYAGQAHLELESLDDIIAQTEGSTPAFIRELMRTAIYAAIRAGDMDADQRVFLRDVHLKSALTWLRSNGNESSQRIIGFQSPPTGTEVGASA